MARRVRTVAIRRAGNPAQPAISWSVVIAGALAGWAVSFIFISLGTGVGLAMASPFSPAGAATMKIGGAIWLIFAHALGFATGGYLAARLRIRDHVPGPETMFRDAAHGFMAWVVGAFMTAGVVVVAALLAALAPSGTGGTDTAANVTAEAAAYASFWSFMAMIFGAVSATLAGILGGELRDEA